jgi:hypothetical protein
LDRKTLLLVGLGLMVRLFFIFPGPMESKIGALANQADLRNYYWPAQTALAGANPYVLWSSGASGEFRADMAPLELLVYVATGRVWNDPRAIQVLFAIFDAINIALLGLLLRQSPLRLPFQVFYALGPLTLYNLALVAEDKTIVLTLTFLIFYLLTLPAETAWQVGSVRVRAWALAIPVAAVLASFKWLSVFYLLPLLLFVSHDWRGFTKNGLVFASIVALAHVPWFPDWSYVYLFRAQRVASPLHIAPARLLSAVGWYDKNLLLIVLAASLLLIYALYWFKRIDIFETMALAVMVGILWTPDMDPVHLSIVVVCLLLIVNWARARRQVVIWVLSALVAAVYAISTHTDFARAGLPDLQLITGAYGSAQMILLSYVLFVVVFGLYLFDKRRGRAVGKMALGAEVDR